MGSGAQFSAAGSLVPASSGGEEQSAEEQLLERKSCLNLASRTVELSCLTGQGLEALKDTIKELVWSGEIKAEMLQVMISSRHQDALQRARTSAVRTLEALRSNLTLELVAMDLRIAMNAVGEIVGRTTTEDLLDSIFSQFCLGK